MKKRIALILAMLMTLVMFTGCAGSSKPTAEDATSYVQAVLDLMCTGDYDHSVELSDVEVGKEGEVREEIVQEIMSALEGEAGFTEENKQRYSDVMMKALEKSNYTVGDAVETEDGGFDVKVSIMPLDIFNGADEKLNMQIDERYDELSAMSEEELQTEVMNMMISILEKNVESPVYGAAQEVTVHYGLLEETDDEEMYGISEEDGEKLGELLFYMPDDGTEAADETAES